MNERCNCIDKTGDLIAKKIAGFEDYIDHIEDSVPQTIPFYHEEQSRIIIHCPYKYLKKNKNGTNSLKSGSIPVISNFCPFCGQKYQD